MTPPAGAISLTVGSSLVEAVNTINRWFSSSAMGRAGFTSNWVDLFLTANTVGIGSGNIRHLTERIVRVVDDASEVASNKTKWAKAGELGEQLARDHLQANGYTILASQLYVRTSAGLRITDFVVTGGKLGTDIAGFEVKVNGADRSSLQVSKDNLISIQGGTIASWRQPNFTHGLPIRYTTYLMYVDLEVR